jgi:cytochrome c
MPDETPETQPPEPGQAPPYAKDGGNIVLVAGILLIIAVLGGGLWLGTHDQRVPVENRPGLSPAQKLAAADCKNCHLPDRQVAGPSYRQIAAKYAATDAEVALLVYKVKHGGSGVWGATPMMAHPTLDESEIEIMVRWILTEYSGTVDASEDTMPPEQEDTGHAQD